MKHRGRAKFDYAQSNWRQSIAVKIASQIIWILVPTAFIASFFIFGEIDKYLLQNFEYKVESLTYRVINVLQNDKSLSDTDKDKIIRNIAHQLNFSDIKVSSNKYNLEPEINVGQMELTSRTVQLTLGDNFENDFINVTTYHEPLIETLNKTKKRVLGVIIVFLTVLATFLVYSIRNKIYYPLSMLVNATEAASNGESEILLDTKRKDEFGHLSIFFREMLDRLSEQHEQLKATAEDAKKANSAKSIFLANMSHELRTPLNAIIGYGELILDDKDDPVSKSHRGDLEKIVIAGQHLLHLINEVLDLSKVEAGKLDVVPETFDLSELFRELETTVLPLVAKQDNKLAVNCSPHVRNMYTDSLKVRQVLINLLGNACKFTEKGKITLQAEPCKIQSIDYVRISVSDTGVGISNGDIENLFKPFTQGDQSPNKSYSGTGLGLAICQKISILLGGNIQAKSMKGVGTTFTVTIPVNFNPIPVQAVAV
ncbi:ATP-binding protein [Kaarinaea lacus]